MRHYALLTVLRNEYGKDNSQQYLMYVANFLLVIKNNCIHTGAVSMIYWPLLALVTRLYYGNIENHDTDSEDFPMAMVISARDSIR